MSLSVLVGRGEGTEGQGWALPSPVLFVTQHRGGHAPSSCLRMASPVMLVFIALVFMPETQTSAQEATPDTASVPFSGPHHGGSTRGFSGLSPPHSPGEEVAIYRWRLELKAGPGSLEASDGSGCGL